MTDLGLESYLLLPLRIPPGMRTETKMTTQCHLQAQFAFHRVRAPQRAMTGKSNDAAVSCSKVPENGHQKQAVQTFAVFGCQGSSPAELAHGCELSDWTLEIAKLPPWLSPLDRCAFRARRAALRTVALVSSFLTTKADVKSAPAPLHSTMRQELSDSPQRGRSL